MRWPSGCGLTVLSNVDVFLVFKLLSALTQPLAWVVLLLLLSLCLFRTRPVGARRALIAALALLLAVGWQPLPDALLRQLENRTQVPAGSLQPYAGIVLLGGAIEPPHMSEGRDQVSLNEAAERMTVPVALMRQYPHLVLLFTGGESGLLVEGTSAATSAQRFFRSLGIEDQRVIYETAARTTYENAVLSAAMPGVDTARPWLLVTSAWHMPRALATFRTAGWNVTPYPVDYLTGTRTRWSEYSLATGALRWQTALHEYFGWLAYAIAGRAGP